MAADYYKILGVEKSSSDAEIQKAYRKLARKYHPDLHPDDKSAQQKFKEVQQAYDVLSDEKKRKLYDQFGADYERVGSAGPGGGPGGQGPFSWSFRGAPGGGAGPGQEGFDFSQLFGGGGAEGFDFSQLFGGGAAAAGGGARRGRASRSKGADVESEVRIPFKTSIVGGEMPLRLVRNDGRVEELVVKIPVGIEDGKKIRLRGKGEPGGGGAGDLLVIVRVESHPYFHRRGDNLYVKLPITLGEAAEGTKVDVPTPSGTVSLRVPAGASSGTKLRIKGHGVAPAGKPAGDLFADVQIVLPQKYDDDELAFIRIFDVRHKLQPRSDLRW
jgi:DnaJ-class molecular chaperone